MKESRRCLLNECLPGSLSLGRTVLLRTLRWQASCSLSWSEPSFKGRHCYCCICCFMPSTATGPIAVAMKQCCAPGRDTGHWVLSVWELEEDTISLRESWLSLHKLRPLSFYTCCLLLINKPVLLLLGAYLTAWKRDYISNPPCF